MRIFSTRLLRHAFIYACSLISAAILWVILTHPTEGFSALAVIAGVCALKRGTSLWLKVLLLVVAIAAATLAWLSLSRKPPTPVHTVESRLKQFGDSAQSRLLPDFHRANAQWPGNQVILVAFKDSKVLSLYSADNSDHVHHVKTYPILGASGGIGPKLREGDHQVPEGVYKIESLNPNSRFHVSLRINYPNTLDLQHAAEERRDRPGSDIMIHGGSASVGCLAMGDQVAEELFTLAASVGIENMEVLLCPTDFRINPAPPWLPTNPPWISAVYAQLETRLKSLPLP
jgi:murein L,D-transpeptidase YafK